MKNQYSLIYKATVGADFLTKSIEKGNDVIQLQLWDTAGTERFHSMGASFYRNSVLCVLVFDLTNPESFNNVEMWRKTFLDQLQPQNPEAFPFVLIGNKMDMEGEITVNNEDIQKYCKDHNNMPYFSASAKESTNVEEAFNKVADLAYEKNVKEEEEFVPPSNINVQIQKPVQKKGCCK